MRALAALVASPLLIADHAAPIATLTDAWRNESLRSRHRWLLDLDAAPQRLREHLAASNARQLGRYAEALWRFWFVHLPGARLHAAGLPVKDALAVRGEFDFIVSLPALSDVQHLEMGYKFYLYCPPGDDFSRLFGPNAADRLDRKWQHMLDVQLPLSQTALGRAALPADVGACRTAGVPSGLAVLPAGGGSAPPIAGVSPAHWRGWWCRSDDWRRPDAPWTDLAGGMDGAAATRWIAPAAIDDPAWRRSRPDACRTRIDAHFAASSQAQLVAGLERGGMASGAKRSAYSSWRRTGHEATPPPRSANRQRRDDARFALWVEFDLRPGRSSRISRGRPSRRRRARSARSPDAGASTSCRIPRSPDRVCFYEVYDDEAAFLRHRDMAHFKTYFAATEPMIAGQAGHEAAGRASGARPKGLRQPLSRSKLLQRFVDALRRPRPRYRRWPDAACLPAGINARVKPEFRRLAQALLAALDRADFPCQADFAKHKRFSSQWLVFKR